MFLVNKGNVYQITRESAMMGLESAILENLRTHYNVQFVEYVVQEIMQHVSFPDVIDSNEVYIYQNEKFSKYILESGIIATKEQYEISQFKPHYNGPEVKEIINILQYSFEQLIYGQHSNSKGMIVQRDENNYGVIAMNNITKEVIAKVLTEILSENDSEDVADSIVQKIYSESIVLAGFIQNNDMAYYSLALDGSCKRIAIFSASELHKVIMSNLPNLKSISKKAESIAIYLHNYILYGAELKDYELVNPVAFKGNRAIFKRNVNGIDFFLNLKNNRWYSGYIKIKPSMIDWEYKYTQRHTGEKVYGNGSYKGYCIVDLEDEDRPSDNIPIMTYGGMKDCGSDYVFYTYDIKKGNKSGEHYYTDNDFDVYIRVALEGTW